MLDDEISRTMYQELIRNELTEAASVLQAFLADEQNLKNIEAAARLLADSFKQEGRYSPAATAAPTAMPCTLPKS
jgi:D-sedoheptulose 7-phosphate isomerase